MSINSIFTLPLTATHAGCLKKDIELIEAA
jgi:hypothetical protein